jgi:hypothetical protein
MQHIDRWDHFTREELEILRNALQLQSGQRNRLADELLSQVVLALRRRFRTPSTLTK